jgi:hypothetical protein
MPAKQCIVNAVQRQRCLFSNPNQAMDFVLTNCRSITRIDYSLTYFNVIYKMPDKYTVNCSESAKSPLYDNAIDKIPLSKCPPNLRPMHVWHFQTCVMLLKHRHEKIIETAPPSPLCAGCVPIELVVSVALLRRENCAGMGSNSISNFHHPKHKWRRFRHCMTSQKEAV